MDNAVCGRGLNHAIEGRRLISTEPDVVFDNALVTAVATIVQGGQTTAVLGNNFGEVSKVSRHERNGKLNRI